MYGIIVGFHVFICLLVVGIVLLQAGRGGGFSGLMGGGGGDALFSTSSQQSGLRKLTMILAGLFMATSLFLTILSSRRTAQSQSVFQRQFQNLPPVAPPADPAAPAPADAAPVAPVAPAVPAAK